MRAQELYDYREESGAISGTDLHDLFRLLFDGEPSPPGAREVTESALLSAWEQTQDEDTRRFIEALLD